MKGKPGTLRESRLVKSEIEAFTHFFFSDMIDTMVERTNVQMSKVRKTLNTITVEQQPFRYSDNNDDETRCFIGLLLFCGLYQDFRQPTKELWNDDISSLPIYRACMSKSRYEWLQRNITFHDHETIRNDFLKTRFSRMRRFVTEFEKKMPENVIAIPNSLVSMKP